MLFSSPALKIYLNFSIISGVLTLVSQEGFASEPRSLPNNYFSQKAHILSKAILVKGTVTAATGETLPGVNIRIKGTAKGTVTDQSGNFSLEVPDQATIVISYIGYDTQEIKITGQDALKIKLTPSAESLNAVVVIGYTSQRRSALTSAVSSVNSKDLNNVTAAGFNEKLQGKVAGLQISPSSGTPGSAIFVRLRGTTSINAGNDPLYVVDGVFINNSSLQSVVNGGQLSNPLSDINPSDIENIEVLKDANATAIYGARGANGVILITTKRGKRNTLSTINVGASWGFSKAPKLWDLASGPETATLLNEAWTNDGNSFASRPYRPATEIINGVAGRGLPEEQKTYDRQSIVFRSAPVQNYNVSLTGGDNKTNFYLGGDFTDQKSIIVTDKFSRSSGRFNLDHNFTDQLKVGTSNLFSYSVRDLSRISNNTKGILQSSVHTPSLLPIYNADGTYNNTVGIFDNVYALINNNNNTARGIRSVNNFYAEYSILKNLKFRTSWSLDYNQYNEDIYYNSQIADGKPNGKAINAVTQDAVWINEQLLSFNQSFNNVHDLNIFVGNTVLSDRFKQQSVTASGFPGDQFSAISSSATQVASGARNGYGLRSYFTGVNYSYLRKYIVDANFRLDASSRFGDNHRWASFPSVGVAWRVNEEAFLRNVTFLDELKVKSSIGLTGNQNINNYASLGLSQAGQNYLDNPGTAPFQLANPDLKWETTRQVNIGVELAFLKRFNVEFNYYDKYTSDLLVSVPVPAKLGFGSTLKNAGAMSNKGFEVSLSSDNIKRDDFTWSTSFNIAHNKNRVEKLPVAFTQYSRDWVQVAQGYPMYSYWLYNELGIDRQTGNAIYEDVNKDGKITASDRKIVGDAWPKFTGGLNNNLVYKNFDLSFLFTFSQGNKVFSMNRYFQEHGGVRGITWSFLSSQLDRWQQAGDDAKLPRLTTKPNADGSQNYDFASSRFLEDGSFIRLRSVTLGYKLPSSLTKKVNIASVRLFTNATNLLTWTKYSGPDPEVNTAADLANASVQGLDFANPPQPRTIIFGLNATF